MKFKVGDIIKGLPSASVYAQTSQYMTKGEVVKVTIFEGKRVDGTDIKVKILEGSEGIGNEWWVDSDHFKLIKSSSNNQNGIKMKKVIQDADKVDVQLAADCTTSSYYGLLTKAKKPYFLVKAGGKWVWSSAGGDNNYTQGDADFQAAMDRALEFDDNFIAVFTSQEDLFRFMSEPGKHHSDLP